MKSSEWKKESDAVCAAWENHGIKEKSMNCPYCGKEMEKGLIQSPHGLAWLKGEKRHTFARAELHEGSVVLSELSMLRGSAVEAWLCRDCGKIVIDIASPASDRNAR